MAIGDGEKLAIRFTQPLAGDVTVGNEDKFTVSFQEYSFVPKGTLSTVERAVESVSGYTSVVREVDISSGTRDKTVVIGQRLFLEDEAE